MCSLSNVSHLTQSFEQFAAPKASYETFLSRSKARSTDTCRMFKRDRAIRPRPFQSIDRPHFPGKCHITTTLYRVFKGSNFMSIIFGVEESLRAAINPRTFL